MLTPTAAELTRAFTVECGDEQVAVEVALEVTDAHDRRLRGLLREGQAAAGQTPLQEATHAVRDSYLDGCQTLDRRGREALRDVLIGLISRDYFAALETTDPEGNTAA